MKNCCFINIIAIAIMALQFLQVQGNTIQSTSNGGLWDDGSTWVGGTIPGTGDTAVINGPVIVGYVDGYDIYHSYAGWVIVEQNGSLVPHEYGGGLGTFILHVSHDLVNRGSILNETGTGEYEYLQLNIAGDIENYGNWGCERTQLTGEDQQLTLGDENTFGGFWDCMVPDHIYAGSDLKFDCLYYTNVWNTGEFNLYDATLHMGNHALDATGTLIYNGTIEGDFSIRGTFSVNKSPSDTLRFTGNITVTDTLQSSNYGGGLGIQNLLVEGNLTNNGVIRDNFDMKNNDQFSILITGDIVNNGKWSCQYVNLIGDEEQYISQAQGKVFDSYFADLDSTSSIWANTDITILQDFNLGRATLYMGNVMLEVNGFLYNGYIDNCLLKDATIMHLTSLDALEIHGTVKCEDGNTFLNSVRVVDTLTCADYGQGSRFYDLIVNGYFYNNGVVMDNADDDKLRLYISEGIENNGIWENSETILTGTEGQSFQQESGTRFGGNFYNMNNQNTLSTWVGDLAFSGSINLGGAGFEMEGNKLSIGGMLHNGTLDNAQLQGGYLRYMDCINGLEMFDRVTIDDSVTFEGQITINDTLIPKAYGGGAKQYHLNIDGSVTNNGVIMDNSGGESLFLFINGDIANGGKWENYLTHVYVSNGQFIELNDDQPIEGIVEFNAVALSGTYQWYFNGTILDSEDFEGETSKVLRWLVPVSSDWYGSFTCETGTKDSVGIIVRSGNFGINDPVKEIDFTVYPNPCQDQLMLRNLRLETRDLKLEIIDISGRTVCEYGNTGIREDEIMVDISHLPAGLYLVKLQTEDGVGLRKVIVQ